MNTAATFDMSFEARLSRVDLTKVMAHVAADTGLGEADLLRAESLYRQFLTLIAHKNADVSYVPPRLVDAVWHAHITFTRQYMADCELLFGSYLHHNPGLDDVDGEVLFGETVRAYAENFGVNLLAYGTTADEWMAMAECKY